MKCGTASTVLGFEAVPAPCGLSLNCPPDGTPTARESVCPMEQIAESVRQQKMNYPRRTGVARLTC